MLERRIFNVPSAHWRRYHPFAEIDRMSRQMDRLNRAFLGSWPRMRWLSTKVFPSINLTEDRDNYYVRAELPGISAEDLDIQVNGRNLTISGERKIQAEGENACYHRREREAGKFSRVIGMPGDIDGEKVDAKMINGLLTVTIAKAEASKPRQITVH